jgi:hypothetical protein
MTSFEKQIFGHRKFGVTGAMWLGVAVFLGFFLAVEFQWNIVENWIGAYLDWHNALRPRIGTAWESFDRTTQAVGKVDTLVGQLRVRESEVESLRNLAEVPQMLSPRGGIAVSKEDFLRLFRGLSPYLWQEWIPAKDLMKLTQQEQWARGYLWWDGSELAIYLVDQNNGVLYRRTIPGDWLEIAALNGERQSGILEETGEFNRRIYPADRLWQVLDSIDDRIVRQLLSSPGLQAAETLHRVGLSSIVVGGLGVVGLEYSTPDGYAVERVVVHDDDLWDLGNILERGKTEEPSPEMY